MYSSKIHIKQDSIVYVWNPRAPTVKQSGEACGSTSKMGGKVQYQSFLLTTIQVLYILSLSLCLSLSVSVFLSFICSISFSKI